MTTDNHIDVLNNTWYIKGNTDIKQNADIYSSNHDMGLLVSAEGRRRSTYLPKEDYWTDWGGWGLVGMIFEIQNYMQVVPGYIGQRGSSNKPGVGLWLGQIWSDRTRCSILEGGIMTPLDTDVLYEYNTQILM